MLCLFICRANIRGKRNKPAHDARGQGCKSVAPSVVNITSSLNVPGKKLFSAGAFFGPGPISIPLAANASPEKRSTGSGVIVDGKNGLVPTNAHVVAGDQIMVHLQDGREFSRQGKEQRPRFDLAVLEIDGPANRLPPGAWRFFRTSCPAKA